MIDKAETKRGEGVGRRLSYLLIGSSKFYDLLSSLNRDNIYSVGFSTRTPQEQYCVKIKKNNYFENEQIRCTAPTNSHSNLESVKQIVSKSKISPRQTREKDTIEKER